MTLGAWARREAVLGSCLAAAAALVALSVPLGVPWLAVASVIFAAVSGLLRLVIGVQRVRLESQRERAESARWLRVPVAPIGEVDPTLIGVDPAAQTVLAGDVLPDYLGREVDAALRDAVAAALNGRGRWLVVVVGGSKVGKSRALFEALRRCARAGELELVAPVDGDALRSLLNPGQSPRAGAAHAVLWLDDLEPFLNQGVTLQTLREWQAGGPGRIVTATYGGKGSELIAGSSTGGLTTLATDVLQHAREIPLWPTTVGELDPLRAKLSNAEFEAVQRHGLAAYLVAGPALERKLTTSRHAPGEDLCPEGVAVVYAAVDWARCGRTDPISHETLRQLWPTQLPAGSPDTDEGFDTGVVWALRPVAATIALLQRAGSYQAYDYVIRLVRDKPGAEPPSDLAWDAAIETATAVKAFAVAVAAYSHSRLKDAATALNRARESSVDEVAAVAGFNLGVVLGELGRSAEEVAVYDEVVARYGEDPAPALREQVATALRNKGVRLGVLGRFAEAVAVYEEVVARYGEDPAPALREQVATALRNKGVVLRELGRSADAVAAYEEVVARYGEDPAPALREPVAMALVAMALVNMGVGRSADVVAAFEEVVARYGEDPAPTLRELVARALINMGVSRSADAVAALEEVVARDGEDPAPALREQVATALDRSADAVAAFEEVVARYGEDPAPVLRELVAVALVNKGVRLGFLGRLGGRSVDEVAAFEEVVARYGEDPAPALREQVATALYNKGVALGGLGRSADAVAAYEEVVARYGEDPAPALREPVARAGNALRASEDGAE